MRDSAVAQRFQRGPFPEKQKDIIRTSPAPSTLASSRTTRSKQTVEGSRERIRHAIFAFCFWGRAIFSINTHDTRDTFNYSCKFRSIADAAGDDQLARSAPASFGAGP